MANPIRIPSVPVRPGAMEGPGGLGPTKKPQTSGAEFKEILLDSLEQVNSLQQEAEAKVEGLVRGETHNVAEVFSAVRKAGVAFNLLMEIRNKLTDAYQEIQQIRL